jgi:hypothetical protein
MILHPNMFAIYAATGSTRCTDLIGSVPVHQSRVAVAMVLNLRFIKWACNFSDWDDAVQLRLQP